jgi:hypothetical protein
MHVCKVPGCRRTQCEDGYCRDHAEQLLRCDQPPQQPKEDGNG